VSNPASPPPLDLDQVASKLAGLQPVWIARMLTAGPLTWRDARASWPRPLLTDRSQVAEPESVGLTLTAADGRTGRLVIWRGGWADIDLLDGDTVTTRNPAIHDLADCVAEARSLARQLTVTSPPLPPDRRDLSPVTVLWVSDWWDGPLEGMASYRGKDCWFQAIFDDETGEWTAPRRCRLYELTDGERQRLRASHRRWEEQAGGNSCYHDHAPDPALKPSAQDFYPRDPPAQPGPQIGEFTVPPLPPRETSPRPGPGHPRAR
jgi:hypothetical protein